MPWCSILSCPASTAWCIGQNPRGRPQHSRHRADRPWRHRQCGVGDARRRPGFRGQAGRHRAAAGQLAQRAQHQRPEGRAAADPPQPRRPADLYRYHHPQRDHGRRCCVSHRKPPPPPFRCWSRANSARQGIVRARHPWQRRAKIETVRRRQLRCDSRQSGGVDPVRPRKGAFDRRHRTPHGQIRRSLRRHAVPRRGLANCRWRRR